MADPIFPTLSVIEKREFEPQRWGLEAILDVAVKQAELEYKSAREDALFRQKALADQRDTLLREINRIASTVAGEEGRAARAEQAGELRTGLAGFEEAGQAARAVMAEEGRMARAEFSEAEAMRRALLREQGLRERQQVAIGSGTGGAGGRGRRIPEEVLAQINATATRPGTGGLSLAESGRAAEGFTALSRDLESRMAGLTAEQRADASLEYGMAVARSLAEKNGTTVEDEFESLVAGDYGDLPPSVLADIDAALAPATPAAGGVPPAPAPVGGASPAAGAAPPGVTLGPTPRAPEPTPVDLGYLESLRQRAAALDEELRRVEAEAAQRDAGSGPGILARAQEIVRASWGPQAAQARMDIRATAKANELLTVASAARGLDLSPLAPIPREDRRLAEIAWGKVKEDPVYKTVRKAVRFGNALTSWETLRASLLNQYRGDPEAMERALAYWKMLRGNPDP